MQCLCVLSLPYPSPRALDEITCVCVCANANRITTSRLTFLVLEDYLDYQMIFKAQISPEGRKGKAALDNTCYSLHCYQRYLQLYHSN